MSSYLILSILIHADFYQRRNAEDYTTEMIMEYNISYQYQSDGWELLLPLYETERERERERERYKCVGERRSILQGLPRKPDLTLTGSRLNWMQSDTRF